MATSLAGAPLRGRHRQGVAPPVPPSGPGVTSGAGPPGLEHRGQDAAGQRASPRSRTSAATSTRSPACGAAFHAYPVVLAGGRTPASSGFDGDPRPRGELPARRRPVARLMAADDTDGLRFYNLSHRWGGPQHAQWPSGIGQHGVLAPALYHAMHGFYVQSDRRDHAPGHAHGRPVHVDRGSALHHGLRAVAVLRHRRRGVHPQGQVGSHHRRRTWRTRRPRIEPGDIVMINTGSHRNWGTTTTTSRYSPGLYTEGAEWLVDGRQARRASTSRRWIIRSAPRSPRTGTGPIVPHLLERVPAPRPAAMSATTSRTGRPRTRRCCPPASPGWRTSAATWTRSPGKRCTFMAFPWNYPLGEGCLLRVVAVIDPEQRFRIPTRGRAGGDTRRPAQPARPCSTSPAGSRSSPAPLARSAGRSPSRSARSAAGCCSPPARPAGWQVVAVAEVAAGRRRGRHARPPPRHQADADAIMAAAIAAYGRVDTLVVASGLNKPR